MQSKQILIALIFVLGPLMCFGQRDSIKRVLERSTLNSIHNTQTYVIQANGQLVELDTFEDKSLIIQNSYPKGGRYLNPLGVAYGYVVFWTRIINHTAFPLEIDLHFSADSFPIINKVVPPFKNVLDVSTPSLATVNPTNKYFKLFLLSDTMALDKIPLLDYGATGISSFLDTCLHESTSQNKIIEPRETYLFYVGIFLCVPDNGPVRTGFVIQDQQLFYSVSIDRQLDERVLIPCGWINLKE